MPKLRVLSGKDVLVILALFGFLKQSQRGSHVKVERITPQRKEILVVPMHTEIDKGTLKSIYRQASRFIDESELHPHFYTD